MNAHVHQHLSCMSKKSVNVISCIILGICCVKHEMLTSSVYFAFSLQQPFQDVDKVSHFNKD